jgi:hypothetical protein
VLQQRRGLHLCAFECAVVPFLPKISGD